MSQNDLLNYFTLQNRQSKCDREYGSQQWNGISVLCCYNEIYDFRAIHTMLKIDVLPILLKMQLFHFISIYMYTAFSFNPLN